ncbi:Cyclohexadienyl dehydratase [Diplonema papillatum]|nr:Cyclohexadienyl dehydratase [Diplonema papillatum]
MFTQPQSISRPKKDWKVDLKEAKKLEELQVMVVSDGDKEIIVSGNLVSDLSTVRRSTDKTTFISVIPVADAEGNFCDKREVTTVALTTDVKDAMDNSTTAKTWVACSKHPTIRPKAKTDFVSLPTSYHRPCAGVHGADDTVIVTSHEQLDGCLVFVGNDIITQALNDKPKEEVQEVFRVGTCGDYPPVTIMERDDVSERMVMTGLEVQILEEAFPGKIEWVQTSWPELHKGLEEGRYDAAYGGINRTVLRAERFQVSDPVLPCGKCVLTSKRFLRERSITRFSDVDRTGVTVITNPGGTNELFCRLNIRKAQIRVARDNRQPFLELVRGKADVMITDTIEAFHRAHTTQELTMLFGKKPLTSGHTVALAREDCPLHLGLQRLPADSDDDADPADAHQDLARRGNLPGGETVGCDFSRDVCTTHLLWELRVISHIMLMKCDTT